VPIVSDTDTDTEPFVSNARPTGPGPRPTDSGPQHTGSSPRLTGSGPQSRGEPDPAVESLPAGSDSGLDSGSGLDSDPATMIDPGSADLIFREAHTPTRFADRPVDEQVLREIHDLVKWAPTSMNTQPMRITLVQGEANLARLLPHLSPGNRAKVAAAPLTVLISADRNFHDQLPIVFPHNPDARRIFDNEVLRERTAVFNTALQLGYFILGARSLGLAVGPMTGLDTAGATGEFFPDGSRQVLAVVTLGYPEPGAHHPRNPRLTYEQVVDVAG